MNTHLERVIGDALALIPQERSAVLLALLDSLEGADEFAVSTAWAAEIAQRKADLRSGAVSAASWTEARARLLAL
jgi:putative addiction module component (TIGR02574 family)